MKSSFEETIIEVWRQALDENADVVVLGTERYPVRLTPKRRLRQVDFGIDGWAQMARAGKRVMQFLSEGRYVANVVDRKVKPYGERAGKNR